MSVMTHTGFEAELATRCPNGKVVAVMGVRGGCGATMVATSLAWMIGNSDSDPGTMRRCILVDLDLHFGSAAMALGVEPGGGLTSLLADPDKADEITIAKSLVPVNDRFGMIATQVPVGQAAPVSSTAAMGVIAALQLSAKWVVVDVPRGLDAAARRLLQTADRVVLVAPPSLEGLRDTRRMLTWLSALRTGAAPLVVVNGASAGGGEVRRKLFEETIGRPVAAWIGAMCGPVAAAAAHALPLAAVAGGREGNPFAAFAALVTGAVPIRRRARLPAWWPGVGAYVQFR